MTGGDQSQQLNGPTILEDKFAIYPKNTVHYHVTLTHDDVTFAPVSSRRRHSTAGVPEKICLKDVIGCHLMKNRDNDVYLAYFCIYFYPYRKKILSKKQRQKQTLTFMVDSGRSFVENKHTATQWKTALVYLCRRARIPAHPASQISVKKRYLLLLNPFSGSGRAMTIYDQVVKPMFTEAEFEYEMVVTERSNHARDMMLDLPLSKFNGVIVMSGDGLVHEILNGMMAREDWEEAAKLPIGIIPTGSGNALASAVMFKSGESYATHFIQHCTFVLLKHVVCPMDLMLVETRNEKLVAFLSLTWGLVADIDIESEKFRKLGSVRFTVGALMRILNLKTYRGRLSFLPNKPYVNRQRARTHSANALKRSMAASSGDVTMDDRPKPMTKSESLPHLAFKSRSRTISQSSDEDTNRDLENLNNAGDRDENSNSNQISNLHITKLKSSQPCLIKSSIPKLDEDIPSSWVTLEEDYVMVTAMSLSHLSTDAIIHPDISWDDNLITLCVIRKGATKSQLLSLMTAMEDGTHLENRCIEFIQCHAFRLEPLVEEGRMAVDGEIMEYGPVQAHVLPAAARVMTGS